MIDGRQAETLTEYWSETAKRDKLYIAIRADDTAEVERLRAEGIVLSDFIKAMLKNGGGSLVNPNEYGMDWYDFSYGLGSYTPEEFISVIRNLYAELGEPIYFSDTVGSSVPNFYSADVFKCVIECFDNKKITKNRTLRGLVDRNKAELLEFVAERGWLRLAKQRDELIEYSRQKGKTECTAFLLEFKNRTADTAAEHAKAEKKLERELNAAPDSVTALKELWKYKKTEDGTLVITGYKGIQTEISVPERIGKSTVTAIGEWAFSPRNYKLPEERRNALRVIGSIALPNTITQIEGYAFSGLEALKTINIPNGVTAIGDAAFAGCLSLLKLDIPDTVCDIGSGAFHDCLGFEQINIPRGITEIKSTVFLNCKKLKSLDIPDSVQGIGERAFSCCKSLESVTIPNGVGEISEGVFSYCEKLTRVELPDTVVKIGKYAFTRCAALKEIVIHEGVREIGEMAFSECKALEKIVLPNSLEKAKNLTQKGEAPKTVLDNSPNVTVVVTPKSYSEKYCKRNGIPFVYKED